jgi:hypothetical protein
VIARAIDATPIAKKTGSIKIAIGNLSLFKTDLLTPFILHQYVSCIEVFSLDTIGSLSTHIHLAHLVLESELAITLSGLPGWTV